jgi:hypothetical protein
MIFCGAGVAEPQKMLPILGLPVLKGDLTPSL